MSRGLAIICAIVALDAVGMGLIMPILPGLLRAVGHTGEISLHYGLLLSAYALMQFLFSPILGALSDRYGRRPVLLVSLAGAAVDYLIMAAAPWLWLLYLSRMVAGITGANMAVATAYITDITAPDERAKTFGWMSAAFGIGFIAGPALGGWLGAHWVRSPFIAAAVLSALNLAMVFLTLPESRTERTPLKPSAFNPFAALHGALKMARLGPLLVVMGLLALIGQVGAAVWVLYTADRYGWSVQLVGISLAMFGLAHAGAQAFVPGPMIKRFGERKTAVIAMIVDGVAYASVGLATHGWILLAMTPVFCIGGIAMPALQSMMTREVSEDEQGQLQGNLAALNSLAGIVGPAGFALLYGATRDVMPGLVWFAGAALYLLCIPPLIVHLKRTRAANAPA